MGVKREFTQEQINYIIYSYTKEFKSMKKIGALIEPKASKTAIRRVLVENNIPIRTDNHLYKANYRTFKIIDSAEKAYWLGFIAADGCVYVREKNATVWLQIKAEDRKHLEKFKEFM